MATSAFAQEACFDLFHPQATSVIQTPSPFTVRGLIPPEFLNAIEAKFGSVKIDVQRFAGLKLFPGEKPPLFRDTKDFDKETEKKYTSLAITMSTGSRNAFLTFQLSFQNDSPHIGEIRFLEIKNPLIGSVDSSLLHQTQSGKGIPFPLLVQIKNRLFQYLANQGVRKLIVPSTADYMVSLLYRRLLGFSPANPRSQTIYDTVDRLYELAKKFPENLKPKSVDEFSRSLKQMFSDELLFEDAKFEHKFYLTNGHLRPNSRIINDDQGNPIALVENYGTNKQQIYYIDTQSQKLIFWRELTRDDGTALSIELI